MIEKVKQIVLEELNQDRYKTIDYNHVTTVVKYAKLLAKRLNADVEIVEISAWLHDLMVFRGDDVAHEITGSNEAEKILKKFGMSCLISSSFLNAGISLLSTLNLLFNMHSV